MNCAVCCRLTLLLAAFNLAAGCVAELAAADLYQCRRSTGKITIDGQLDDAAWQNAQAIENFSLPWLRDNARPAKTKTVARLLWDEDYLYFAAQLEDHDLYADVKEHDGMTWENDVFELFFKPHDDRRGYYEFQINPLGTKMDMYLPSRGSGAYRRWKSAHDFGWEAKVQLQGTLNDPSDRDAGWTVEGRFPWTDFAHTGGHPEAGSVWKFALCRYDYSVDFEEPELSTSAPLQAASFHRYEDYGVIKFVK